MPAVGTLPRAKPDSLPALLLRLWHLLSLDAPTVAGLWACLLAHAAGVVPQSAAILVLVWGTWLMYVADRLLDGQARSAPLGLRERHHFARRFRKRFLIAGAIVTASLTWLVFTGMSARARSADAVIFSAAMMYFGVVHGLRRRAPRWLSKEAAVAVLFAAATAIPAWSQIAAGSEVSQPRIWRLASAAFIFAALCWLNCVAIEHWESEPCGGLLATGRATLLPGAGQHLSIVAAVLAACSLAITPALLSFPVLRPLAPVLLAVAGSALLLFVIEQHSYRLGGMQLRIAADLALLTPLLPLALLRWSRHG